MRRSNLPKAANRFDTHYCRVVVTIGCPQVGAFTPNAANVYPRSKRK
jgi:hypothetical protein